MVSEATQKLNIESGDQTSHILHNSAQRQFIAQQPIVQYRLVKFADHHHHSVMQAGCCHDLIFGVNQQTAPQDYQLAEVVLQGLASVEYAHSINAGDLLTSDDCGRAVRAQPPARTIGIAMQQGKAGEIGKVLIRPSMI